MKSYQYDPRAYKTWHKFSIDCFEYRKDISIRKWMRSNMIGRYKTIFFHSWTRDMYFEKEEDLVLFKLTWL